MSPVVEANRLLYGAALLYSALGSFQVYLTGHAVLKFFSLPVEGRRHLRRYVHLLGLILSISITRFILYLRESTVNLTDWPDRTQSVESIPLSPPELAISYAATTLQALVGDAFLVWRATILWNHNHLLKWLPVTFYVLYLGCCIISSIFKARAWKQNFLALSELDRPNPDYEHALEILRLARISHQHLFTLDFAASVVVTSVTTILVTVRLVLAKREMERFTANLGGLFKSTLPYRRVITLLLESSLPFTLVGIVGAIATACRDANGGGTSAATFVSILMYAIWCNSLALAPQFIIYRIITGTTWISNPTTQGIYPFSQPIRFTHDTLILNPITSRSLGCEEGDRRWEGRQVTFNSCHPEEQSGTVKGQN